MILKNNKAFSLIEILIAAGILSLTFFGVYKLIGENTKIISNSDNYTTANSLFLPFEECIKNLNISNNESFYIGLNSCQKETSKTGITLNNIDYILYGSGIGNNSFDLYIIFDGTKVKQKFILK